MSNPVQGQSSQNVPGIQKQNVAWLKAQTELMNAQTKYMQALSKIKKEDMDAMTNSIVSVERFASSGGFEAIFSGSVSRVKDNLTTAMDGALAPLTNAATKLVNDLLAQDTPLGAKQYRH